MQPETLDRELALRIDVDFQVGLREAVPFFLEQLAAAEMRATFFIVAGCNRPGASITRLFRPGYLKRLHGLGTLGVAKLLRRSSRDRGRFLEGDAERATLQAIRDQGHEIAVHGFDHAWWADNIWRADPERVGSEIERAFEATERATGLRGLAWGSPSWRTTGSVLATLARRGVPYFSDCWGHCPFFTVTDDDETLEIPHLPINLSSLEAAIVAERLSEEQAIDRLFGSRLEGTLGVACFHDYFEGFLRPELFRRFLDACSRRSVRTVSLIDAARRLERVGLPRHRLSRAPLSGFDGEVSWQGTVYRS